MEENLYAWFFSGGMVGIPKRLLGMMEPLHLEFADLGKIIYLLYCNENGLDANDCYAEEALRTLEGKGLVRKGESEAVDFSPMFAKIAAGMGNPTNDAHEPADPTSLSYGELIKRLEREQSRFLGLKEKQALEEAHQRYQWDYAMVYELFRFYGQNFRRHTYDFAFFCQMAYGAKVVDETSLLRFFANLDTTDAKVQEVLRRLGKYNNPTMKQKEVYLKWTNLWKFSHEMILLAADENIAADNPSIAYTDSVLGSWQAENIHTPEELAQWKQAQAEQKAALQQAKRTTKPKSRRDAFSETKRDLNYLVE